MPPTPGSQLGPYKIVGSLGAGGMGEVYRAHDPRLGRDVALKILPEATAHDPLGLERFAREARAVAALNHPHIVTIYSTEEAEGLRFITMELIEGRTLDQVISSSGVSVAQIFDVATALADALAAAHQKQITHRDLKPANVMISNDGRVKVLDFGLASASEAPVDSAADQATRERLTRAGTILGTMPYMSPEQIEAKPLDGRSDIFSLGIILYEMAAGLRPFRGDSSPALMASILREHPKALSEIRRDVPADLARLIGKCLEKEPRDRPQSAQAMLIELKALRRASESLGASATAVGTRAAGPSRFLMPTLAAVAFAAVILVVTGVWYSRRGVGAPPSETGAMSLAVLPIENLGGDSGTDYLADGMTGELASALKKIPGLQVVGDLSTFRFKGTHTAPSDIARQLGVSRLLTGKLQPGNGRVRLQVQLSNPQGTLLWSNTYDRSSADTFALQDEITGAVASELRMMLSPDTLAATRAGRTTSAEAHDLYMRGQFEKNKVSEASLRRALELFQQALKLDPNYAQAHAGMAFAYDMLADTFAPAYEYHTLALEAARKAIAIDGRLADARVLVGYEMAAAEWDLEKGRAEMERGLALDPNSSDAIFVVGMFSWITGEGDRAIALADRLIKVDPLSALAARLRADALSWRGRYEEALEQHRVANRLDPGVILFEATNGWAMLELGRYDEAESAFLDFQKTFDQPSFGLAMTYGRLGRRDDALRVIRAVEAREQKQWVDPDFIAAAYAAMGDRDHAMEWLEKAFQKKAWVLRAFMNWDHPWLRSMHDDPRFKALKQRVLKTTFKR